MDIASVVSEMETEHRVFAAGAVVAGALTALVVVGGTDAVQAVLFGSFSLYLLGGAYPAIEDHVPEYRRKGAIALGAIGLLGFLVGTQSALPVLFVLGGAMALLKII